MTRARTGWTVALACAWAAACSEPYVLLEIDARDTVRDARRVTVTIADGAQQEASRDIELVDTLGFPKTLTVAIDGRTGPFALAVDAFDDDGQLVGSGTARATGDGDERIALLLEPADFGVNAIVRFDQRLSELGVQSIAGAPDGSFLIAWETPERSVAARLFDPTARPKQNAVRLSDLDFIVPSHEYAGHGFPAVVHGAAGFLALWETQTEVFDPFHIRRYVLDTPEAAPPPVPDFGFGGDDVMSARLPAAAPTATGYLVAYSETDFVESGEAFGVPMLVRLDELGNPQGVPVVLGEGDSQERGRPAIATVDDARAIVVWPDFTDFFGVARARFVDAATGAPAGPELALASRPDHDMQCPVAVGTGDGGFAAAWLSAGNDISFELQRFDAAGAPIGGPTRVATLPDHVFLAPIALARDPAGNIAAVWADGLATDVDVPVDVYLRMFRPSGMPIGDAQRVNTEESGTQSDPSVIARSDGSFVVVWTDTSGRAPDVDDAGIRARVMYPNLAPTGGHGGTCEGEADCGDGLTCVAATGLCHQRCDEPNGSACTDGGKCVDGACVFD